jgi:hypothetical protein
MQRTRTSGPRKSDRGCPLGDQPCRGRCGPHRGGPGNRLERRGFYSLEPGALIRGPPAGSPICVTLGNGADSDGAFRGKPMHESATGDLDRPEAPRGCARSFMACRSERNRARSVFLERFRGALRIPCDGYLGIVRAIPAVQASGPVERGLPRSRPVARNPSRASPALQPIRAVQAPAILAPQPIRAIRAATPGGHAPPGPPALRRPRPALQGNAHPATRGTVERRLRRSTLAQIPPLSTTTFH